MNAYIKGGLVAIGVGAAILTWYKRNESGLIVNRTPDEFQLITKMEVEGLPDFELERLDGTKVKLSDYRGKLLVVNFWATWCNPCVEEMPSMARLVDRMKGDVVVVAVATDEKKEDIATFLKAFGIPKPGFEVLWDRDHSVMKLYGVKRVPESFLSTPDFKLARKIVGTEDWGTDNAVEFFKALKGSK